MGFCEVSYSVENHSVLEALEKRLPKSAQAYNAIKLISSGKYLPSVSTKVYAFNGNLSEDEVFLDVFIVIIQYRQIYNDIGIIISSPNVPTAEMYTAFEEIVDFKYPICFCAVDSNYSKFIAELCKKHGELSSVDPCDFMTISLQTAQHLQLNESRLTPSIEVRELEPRDAELVARRWQFSQEGTKEMLAETIACTGSAGVYMDGKLISWVVIFAIGSINALFTEVEFRGKGYGEITMQKVCQIAAQKGLVPNVQVHIGNSASSRLMEKVGFRNSHQVEWVIYNPNQKARVN